MTELYRHFSGSGELLYIGVANSTTARLRGHQRSSCWAHEIARIEIERFASREAALEAETLAIFDEQPKHNVKHTHAAKVPHAPLVPRNTVGLAAAIAKAGSQKALADGIANFLGRSTFSQQTVSYWIKHEVAIEAEYWPAIEHVTANRVTRADLRPDVFASA